MIDERCGNARRALVRSFYFASITVSGESSSCKTENALRTGGLSPLVVLREYSATRQSRSN